MNYKRRILEMNRIENLIRLSNRSGSNCNKLVINTHNSKIHEKTKFIVFDKLRRAGFDVWTEPIFTSGVRPDILCYNLESGESYIIEILASETKKKALIKTQKYPKDIEIIYIKAKENPDLSEVDDIC